MKKEIVENIMTEYNKKRLRAASDADMRKSEVYDRIPGLENIDKEIQLTGIKISKIIISNPEDMESEVSKLKKDLEYLKQSRDDMYKKYNVPKSFSEPDYLCKLCNDTGYGSDGKKCKCFNTQIIDQLYKMSNMIHMLNTENFDTFNIDIFSNDAYSGEAYTPRQNMYGILGTCEDFCYNFETVNTNLLFYGGTGLGKTFMCNCIAKVLIDRGRTVLYQTAFSLFEIIEGHKFNRANENEADRINYNMMFESELLIIDDLGTEFANSFTNAELFNIINARLISEKKTVISTNLSLEQLAETYSDRVMSRVLNKFTACKFYGRDLRLSS